MAAPSAHSAWPDFGFMLNQAARAIEPGLPLGQVIVERNEISEELADPPRLRLAQLRSYFDEPQKGQRLCGRAPGQAGGAELALTSAGHGRGDRHAADLYSSLVEAVPAIAGIGPEVAWHSPGQSAVVKENERIGIPRQDHWAARHRQQVEDRTPDQPTVSAGERSPQNPVFAMPLPHSDHTRELRKRILQSWWSALCQRWKGVTSPSISSIYYGQSGSDISTAGWPARSLLPCPRQGLEHLCSCRRSMAAGSHRTAIRVAGTARIPAALHRLPRRCGHAGGPRSPQPGGRIARRLVWTGGDCR